jgi:hypothetical protein
MFRFIIFSFAFSIAAGALICPALLAKDDPSKVRSVEPICVKNDKLFANAKTPEVIKDVVKREGEEQMEVIISGALGGEVDAGAISVYIQGIAMFAVLPILMCIFNGFSGGCHCFARVVAGLICPTSCCCALCMCRPSTKKPYDRSSKVYPIFLYGLFTFGCVITAIYGTAGGTGQFTPTFTRGSCLIDNTRVKVGAFIEQFRKPVVKFKGEFSGLSDYVASTVGSTYPITVAINELVAAYDDVNTAATPAGQSYTSTYPGDVNNQAGCTEPLKVVRTLTSSASSTASNAGNNFKTTMSTIAKSVNSTLVGLKKSINEQINSASTLIDNLKSQVDASMKAASNTMLGQAKELESNPNIISSVSFSAFNWIYLVTSFFAGGVVLILLNSHKHFVQAGSIRSNPKMEGNVLDVGHVGSCGARIGAWSWCCVFLFGAVASGLGAAFYPISKVYGDICMVSGDLPLKLGTLMGGSRRRELRNFQDTLGQYDAFSYISGKLTMFRHANEQKLLQSRSLASSNGMNVNNILQTCWEDGSIYDAMDLGTKIPINGTEMFSGFGNVPDNGALGPESTQALDALADEINNNINYCPAARTNLIAKLAIVKTKTNGLQTAISNYRETLNNIKVKAVNVLEEKTDQIRCIRCGFIKVVWDDVLSVVCGSAKNALTIFAECMVAIGFLAFFVGSFQLLILRRWGGHGPIKAHEHGDDGLQLGVTRKLESVCGCLSHYRKKDEPEAPVGYEMQKNATSTADYPVASNIDDSNVAAQYDTQEYAAQYEQQVDGEVEGELI